MRRSPQLAELGHSWNVIGTVGSVAVDQNFVQSTALAEHASPFVPHSQVGAVGWTPLTWK